MARMIPDYIHRDCQSSAERRLFERFRKELSDTYVVLHSLGLAKHANKPRAEIDFVVVCRMGLLCLEVKGGRIRQERGVWSFINRYGEVNRKRESPFEQAASGMFALRRSIEQKFGHGSPQREAIFGYAVVFLDQSFSLESPEWDLKRLIDANRFSEQLEKLILNQFDYSLQEIKRITGQECQTMSDSQTDLLLKYLRPDFDVVPSISSRIRECHENLLRLTEEQYDVLDQLDANERVMISGGAGTGKTMLAVEKARREAQKGRRVAFFCYNQLLARHIRQILQRPEGNLIEVNTLHGYARKLIAAAGLDNGLPSDCGTSELFLEKYPVLFEKAFVELYDASPFDMLVVDEGQDLTAKPYLGMLDWLVQGGITRGRWVWFEDTQQDIFRPGRGAEVRSELDWGNPAVCRLTKNCRNTKPISIFTSLATATNKQKCLVDSDLKVSPSFYKSRSHQLKLLENILTVLLKGRVDPSDIVLLSPYVQDNSVLKGLEKIGSLGLFTYGGNGGQAGSRFLRYTTIQKFKGLEAKVIIVTDIADLVSPEMRTLNYVAFSRPTSCLEVLIHEDARDQYNQLAYEFGLR